MKKNKLTAFIVISLALILITVLLTKPFLRAMGYYLVIQHTPQKTDAIVVLSGGKSHRVNMGATLYQKGFAPKIIMTGGYLHQISIPYLMKQEAIKKGVPSQNILLETNSQSTYDHPKFIHPILDKNNIHSITLVTSKFHTRRALQSFKKYYKNSDLKIFIVGAEDKIDYENWWSDHNMTESILIEWAKIIWYFIFL